MAEINERAEYKPERGQRRRGGSIGDHDVGGREIHDSGDRAKGYRLGERPVDNDRFRIGPRSGRGGAQRREIDLAADRDEVVPQCLMCEIENRPDHQRESRQTGRDRKFTEHHIVRRKVEPSDDDTKSDRLGDRLFDPKSGGKRNGWRVVLLWRRRGATNATRLNDLIGIGQQAPAEPGQIAGSQHRATADHDAGDQRCFKQESARQHP